MVSILLEFPLSNRLRPPVRLSWIKNMNMKKSRLWLSLLILSYIQTIFFKSCMSFIASCSSPAMLNLFLQRATKLSLNREVFSTNASGGSSSEMCRDGLSVISVKICPHIRLILVNQELSFNHSKQDLCDVRFCLDH